MKKSVLLLAFAVITAGLHAQVSTASTEAAKNYTPLHWAASQGYVEMIKVLVGKSYDLNAKDENGFTPLHYAAVSGQIEAVKYLTENGADIYAVNSQNFTPLTLAAKTGQQDIVDYLFIKMRSVRMEQLKAQIEKDRVETDLAQAARARYEAENLRSKAESWAQEAKRWRDEAEKWNKEAAQWKAKQVLLDKIAQERLTEALKAQKASEDKFLNERAAKLEALRYAEEVAAAQRAQAQARQAAEAALRAQQASDRIIQNLAEEIEKQGGNPGPIAPLPTEDMVPSQGAAYDVLDAYENAPEISAPPAAPAMEAPAAPEAAAVEGSPAPALEEDNATLGDLL